MDMTKESFNEMRKATEADDSCVVCGKESSRGVHGMSKGEVASKYYCKKHSVFRQFMHLFKPHCRHCNYCHIYGFY